MDIKVKKYKLYRLSGNYYLSEKTKYYNYDYVIAPGSVRPLYIDGDILDATMLNNTWEKVIAAYPDINDLYTLDKKVCDKLFKKEIEIEQAFNGLYDVIVDTDIANFYISLAKQVANCTGSIKVSVEQEEYAVESFGLSIDFEPTIDLRPVSKNNIITKINKIKNN